MNIPKIIKIVVVLLLSSSALAFIGTYLDMEFLSENGSYDPNIYLMDLIWLAIILWLAWNLSIKKKDIRPSLGWVGLIILVFEFWDYIEFGFSNSNYAYALELAIYITMLILLSKPKAKEWFISENPFFKKYV